VSSSPGTTILVWSISTCGHLRHVATLPWEIKNWNFLQIFSRYGRICKQILIFWCLKQWLFPLLIANEIFHVTVLLPIYFCDQFVAPEIHHSRRHCSVCNQHGIQRWGQDFEKFVFEELHCLNVFFSAGHAKCATVWLFWRNSSVNLFAVTPSNTNFLSKYCPFSSIFAEYLQKFQFLISKGNVATCLRWDG